MGLGGTDGLTGMTMRRYLMLGALGAASIAGSMRRGKRSGWGTAPLFFSLIDGEFRLPRRRLENPHSHLHLLNCQEFKTHTAARTDFELQQRR